MIAIVHSITTTWGGVTVHSTIEEYYIEETTSRYTPDTYTERMWNWVVTADAYRFTLAVF